MREKKLTKKGAASFYVVIFTALIMSVIVLSFVRLMLSEQSKTGGNDLSQSAYDAALAGVEDAKTVLAQCAKNNFTGEKCAKIFEDNCNTISSFLYGTDATEIDQTGEEGYTCVTMTNITEDYRETVAGDAQRVTMVPLRTENNEAIAKVKIQWSNTAQYYPSYSNNTLFPSLSEALKPAVVTAQFIDGGNPSAQWGDGKVRGAMMVLYPIQSSSSSTPNTNIAKAEVLNAADPSKTNKPYKVQCSNTVPYTCSATIDISGTPYGQKDNGAEDYLVLGTPYGGDGADFVVQMQRADGTAINFKDAQIAVDSTGRTNDYYRRVESRVNMTNTALYPEYTMQLSSEDSNSGKLEKNFWVTQNCWKMDSGTKKSCDGSNVNNYAKNSGSL